MLGVQQALGLPDKMVRKIDNEIERKFGLPFNSFMPIELGHSHQGSESILVIHDENDKEVGWTDGEEMADLYKAKFLKTEGLGHRRILRDPNVIVNVVKWILDVND